MKKHGLFLFSLFVSFKTHYHAESSYIESSRLSYAVRLSDRGYYRTEERLIQTKKGGLRVDRGRLLDERS